MMIIGYGNMGKAVYGGLSKSFSKDLIYVCDKYAEGMKQVPENNRTTDVNKFIESADIIILAVKPQSFEALIKEIKVDLTHKLIISIMAGVPIQKLQDLTKARKIVRSMPNLPIKVDEGVIGWIATDEVTNTEKILLRKMFSNLGIEIEIPNEKMIDVITAISGSGPAYFYYLCEILEKKAIEYGLSEEGAKKIASATFIGSAILMSKDTKSAGEWRKSVTSKGGTTEAALNHLIENDFDKIFEEAIDKAKKKSENF